MAFCSSKILSCTTDLLSCTTRRLCIASMASFSSSICARSASSCRTQSSVVTECGSTATRMWTAAAGSGHTSLASTRRPRLAARLPDAARARCEVRCGAGLARFADEARVPCIHASCFTGDGARSNSEAAPPPSVSLGIGMVAPCGMGGQDDDNNLSPSPPALPGIVTGCAAMFPPKLGSVF